MKRVGFLHPDLCYQFFLDPAPSPVAFTKLGEFEAPPWWQPVYDTGCWVAKNTWQLTYVSPGVDVA